MRPTWPFVGRTAEVEAAVAGIGRYGEPGVLLVGEAGVGKSRMLESAALRCRDEGMHVVVTAGAEASNGLPFAAMAALLPERGHRDDPANVFAAAAGTLREAAGDRTCVLVVDDVHHLDDASAALVQHLAATTGARVLAAARTGSTGAPAVVALLRRPFVRVSAVEGLNRATVGALLVSVLGGPVDGLTVDRLWRVTRGNPLFLRHLVEACRASGTLRRAGDVWRWKGQIPVQHRLSDLVASLLGGLTAEEAHALSYVAHAEPVPLDVIETLVDASVLVELEQRSLITVERVHRDLVVRMGHPLYGESVRARSGAERRRDVHRALARAVTHGDTADHARLRAVTWRLAAGDPVPGDQVVGAARDALTRCDAPLAERLARHAGTAAGAGVLARALVAQDKAGEAEELLSRCAAGDGTEPPDELARLAALRALNLCWNLRRPAEAAEVVRSARVSGPPGGGAAAELAVAELALAAFGDGSADLSSADLSCLSAGVRDDVIASVCDPLRAYLDVYLGRPARVADAYAAGRLGGPRVWSAMGAAAAACHVEALALTGRLDEAFAVARSGYRTAVEREASAEASLLAFGVGVCEMWAGRPGRALPRLQEARALLDDHAPFPIQVYVFSEHAVCLAAVGRFAESRRVLEEIGRRLPAASNLRGHLTLAEVRVDAQIEGRRVKAAEAGASLGEHYRSTGWYTKAVEAFYHSVRLRPSRVVAEALHEVAGRCDSELFALFDRHAQAVVGGDVDGLLTVADALEARGYHSLAWEAVSSAAGVADGRGDDRLAARLRIRVRDLAPLCEGYRPPWTANTGPQAALSERERETCELAAGGLTNDAIAERLCLSRRTVANHLQRAYGKLGVRSRDDLPRALGLERPVPPVGLAWLAGNPPPERDRRTWAAGVRPPLGAYPVLSGPPAGL
ncbi:DNA-binding CsgD family transcriptional regulator [Streptosporangium becharense]|uniref:DNA-binding CsgD family transcriptional regulator n=1 Tax=Streptosporangium becharense TaxID=1816182 RepID=A0A7W9MIH5_9ACTN|nr:LuxR family transcriptional regulator [Streptosporangium becharense]MBB2911409.1 DNA-binding CsgD family transcriptional regulator [Streptosporangium becharense]MBB5821533.1 DNA-binding CsgD family transcriptional regulator [Streptosporangium becharense]